MKKYFLIGIAGSGMSSLGLFLKQQGHSIAGSDRSLDQRETSPLKQKLISIGFKVYPQNGLHINKDLDGVIYSSAVETDNPDFLAARKLALPLLSRAQMLADIFNQNQGIAVSGTSGKTTVVGMLAHVLKSAGLDFSFIAGGIVKEWGPDKTGVNAYFGRGPLMLIEADESDGSITLYKPHTSVLTNISEDHKSLDELTPLFQHLLNATKKSLIINGDCLESAKLTFNQKKNHKFSLSEASKIRFLKKGSRFQYQGIPFSLMVPGIHNVMNALAAIKTSLDLGMPYQSIQEGLKNFKGIARRLELIGINNQIRIYDDYSHNPEKIKAAITALQPFSKRLLVIYQPHGFGPMKLQWNELIRVFSKIIRLEDQLIILPIFDAGGTADRTVRSEDFVKKLQTHKIPVQYFSDRKDLIHWVKNESKPEDSVLVMGARDNSLTDLAHDILRVVSHK